MAASADRQRVSWWCALFAGVILAMAAPAARDYRTAEFDSLSVTIDTDWAPRSAPGYWPARFDITNTGDARVIEIVGAGSRFFRPPPRSANGSTTVRQEVRLAKGDRVRLTIPVPVFADSENIRFEIREQNRVLQSFSYSGFQSRVSPADASVLLIVDATSALGRIAPRLQRNRRSGGGFSGGPVPGSVITSSSAPDFVLEPARVPANWIGFTSLRAVVIGPAEWAELGDAQKSALLGWTAGGGDLIVVDGNLGALVPAAHGEAASDPDRVVARHFFGRIHVVTSESLLAASLPGMLLAAAKSHELFWALPANTVPDWGIIEGRGFRLRIPGIEGVPARVYLSILVLFSLLIGPANYWWLWRKRRLVLLVLTAPLISVVFILLLAAYAVAGEGLSVQGRAVTFTMLDQSSQQAVTRSSVSLYAAGMTPAGGLSFARDVAVFPLGTDGVGTRDRLDLDLTEAQRFTGGVVHARSPTNFEQIAVRAARERLTFTHEQGGLTVTNGLEAAIVGLVYRDGDTLYRLNGSLASGAKHTLEVAAAGARPALPAGLSIPPKFVSFFEDQPRGSYLAVLETSPFWEPGVAGVIERGSLHVVLGWPEGRQ